MIYIDMSCQYLSTKLETLSYFIFIYVQYCRYSNIMYLRFKLSSFYPAEHAYMNEEKSFIYGKAYPFIQYNYIPFMVVTVSQKHGKKFAF